LNQPLITIITPCYNSQEYLRETINSVLKQTYRNFEWILVNDGSSDKTEDIILGIEDDRIKYLYQENKGQCAASNLGLSHSKGQFIKFLDSDDLLNATHLENLVKCIVDDETLVSCAWGKFYNDDVDTFRLFPEKVSRNLNSLEWIKTSISQRYDMMAAWIWLIPKPIIYKSGMWDETLTLNNDFDFSIRLLINSKNVVFCSNAILMYRELTQSLSKSASYAAFCSAVKSNLIGVENILRLSSDLSTKQLCADRLQDWVYQCYPKYIDLVLILETKIQSLGGSKIKIEGGNLFKLCALIFGWKFAARLRFLLNTKS
jgi:glycosyltransferase involved in cell wall biosynthesis